MLPVFLSIEDVIPTLYCNRFVNCISLFLSKKIAWLSFFMENKGNSYDKLRCPNLKSGHHEL